MKRAGQAFLLEGCLPRTMFNNCPFHRTRRGHRWNIPLFQIVLGCIRIFQLPTEIFSSRQSASAPGFSLDDRCISAIGMEVGVQPREETVQLALCFNGGLGRHLTRVPEAEAVGEGGTDVASKAEARRELVAVAEVEPVVVLFHAESAATFVLLGRLEDVERVDVTQAVATRLHPNARMHRGNAHVGEGVVVAFHQQADGVHTVVAHDVHLPWLRR